MEKFMHKKFAIAVLAFGALTTLSVASSSAKEYPYCLQGDRFSISGDCSFESFAQCKATASGQRADCGLNPRFALGQQNYGDRSISRRERRVYRNDVNEGFDFSPRY